MKRRVGGAVVDCADRVTHRDESPDGLTHTRARTHWVGPARTRRQVMGARQPRRPHGDGEGDGGGRP